MTAGAKSFSTRRGKEAAPTRDPWTWPPAVGYRAGDGEADFRRTGISGERHGARRGERSERQHAAGVEFQGDRPSLARWVRRHGRGHVDPADEGRPPHPVDGA